ncbi:MAG: [FeFe] hydrogenase H-cluster radical SAM maturase HydE [Ignavibacteria bacterium]
MDLEQSLFEVETGNAGRENLTFLLGLEDKTEKETLYKRAYAVKEKYIGRKVYFRGLIELSNICQKDCCYCGVRKSNKNVQRYQMTEEQAVKSAMWSYKNSYGSIVIQAGERADEKYIAKIENIVKRIKEESGGHLGITLSLGEQSKETYQRWFEAGAHRYLLRIESSNEALYKQIHPADHIYADRIHCLQYLRETGYQVGTGVMIGLPNQTIGHLAEDLLFFKSIDADMIGMGPYIIHKETPMVDSFVDFNSLKKRQFELSLKMIACARLLLKDVNIASTTALQALKATGRELGLLAGANIIMPNITDTEYRAFYQLYEDKPCINENAGDCIDCLQKRIEFIGETIGLDEWGDSVHFSARNS